MFYSFFSIGLTSLSSNFSHSKKLFGKLAVLINCHKTYLPALIHNGLYFLSWPPGYTINTPYHGTTSTTIGQQVAEQLINPFGDDDEDFELNWLIDRHMKVLTNSRDFSQHIGFLKTVMN